MSRRRWVGAAVALLVLAVGYILWIRSVWVDEGSEGIGRAAALATIVQAPLVVISVGVAAWQVVQSARASRQQAEDGARLERERTRPYVGVNLDVQRDWMNVYLDVENFGPTAARNVRIDIDPPLKTSLTDVSSSPPHEAGFLTTPIGTLVPHQRLSTLVEIGPLRGRAVERGEELPTRFVAHVTYEDSAPLGGPPQIYVDEFVLDFQVLLDTTKVTRHTMHELVDRVEKLTKVIENK